MHLVTGVRTVKAYNEEDSMLDTPVVFKDNALAGTSAWANTFLGRDHHAGENHDQVLLKDMIRPRRD